jgi:predicted cobalt transporter CbtA
MVGMMRDHWWWPWWVSTLIDVAVVILALIVFRRSRQRVVRAVTGLLVVAGLVAAVMAPIVMTDKPEMKRETPMMP